MIALAMGVVLTGYTLTLYGWILLKGYNVSFMDLFTSKYWPPQPATDRKAGATS